MPVGRLWLSPVAGLSPDEIKIKLNKLYRYIVGILLPPAGMKSLLFSNADYLEWQPAYIEPVDTLGAGDAFLAFPVFCFPFCNRVWREPIKACYAPCGRAEIGGAGVISIRRIWFW